MSSPFYAHINNYVPLNEGDMAIISQYTKPVTVGKKEFLLKEGQLCRNNYFVEKGCLRMFFIDQKGTEQITQFAIENWWLSDYMSFTLQKPSQFCIQTIEASALIAIDHLAQEQLLQQLPKLERYFRLILQRAYAATQMRMKFLHDFSREENYHHFINTQPEFAQRVPQYMLASYLGLTPEYLSEIRKKKR